MPMIWPPPSGLWKTTFKAGSTCYKYKYNQLGTQGI